MSACSASLCFASASMGFSADEYSSGLLVTHLLYKIALVIAVVRWVLSWFLRRRDRIRSLPSVSSGSDEMAFSPSTAASTQMIRDSLIVTTFEDLTERLPETSSWDTCAVCLNQLSIDDEIRELRNCCHVFHRECIDRWIDRDHENHVTCPLCRSALLTSSQFHSLSCGSGTQPSWAVERLLYLFGDDLYCN